MIEFVRTPFSDFAYFPTDIPKRELRDLGIRHTPTITYRSKTTHMDGFALLHEFGHHFCDHGALSDSITEQEEVDGEIDATCYIFECIKPEYFAGVYLEFTDRIAGVYGERYRNQVARELAAYIRMLNL